MMLGLHGRPNDAGIDTFEYFLALQLHRTVDELRMIPHSEFLGWHSYFTAKTAIENKKPKG